MSRLANLWLHGVRTVTMVIVGSYTQRRSHSDVHYGTWNIIEIDRMRLNLETVLYHYIYIIASYI